MIDSKQQANCFTLIAGKNVSAYGRVIVGHNEDDEGLLAVRQTYVPPRDWPEGSFLPAEKGHARIPQLPHTFGYYWVEYKGDLGGMITADAFANENGVVITSNSMCDTRESNDDPEIVCDGGIGYNLRRVLAERSRSARDGAQILMEMVKTWGYAPSGRAYTIADKDEAFMFQLVRGHHYVGARVPDDAVIVMPNHYTFHTLHDCPEMFYSDDIIDYAIQKGWYTPAAEGDTADFDYAKAYQLPKMYRSPINVPRQIHGQQLVMRSPCERETAELPFAVYPDRKLGIEDFFEVLSTHYEGTQDDTTFFGPGHSPHDDEASRRICTGITLASQIYLFDDSPELLTVFSCPGRPCQLPFLPLHPLLTIPSSLRENISPERMMETHLLPEPGLCTYTGSVFQRFRDFGHRNEMVYSRETAEVREILHHLLTEAIADSSRTVTQLRKLLEENRREEAVQYAETQDDAFLRMALEKLEAYAEAHPIDMAILPLDSLSLSAFPETLKLKLRTSLSVTEDSMIFGIGHTDTHVSFAHAEKGSLLETDGGYLEVVFKSKPFLEQLHAPGKYSFWLGGNEVNGNPFAARALITVTE